MLRGWAGRWFFLTSDGPQTTYEYRISPIPGWQAREKAPVAERRFKTARLGFDPLIDSALSAPEASSARLSPAAGVVPMKRPSFTVLASLAGLLLSCQLAGTPDAEVTLDNDSQTLETELAGEAAKSPEHKILRELRARATSLSDAELELLARTILEESERHHFEPELILAVIFVESSGRPAAVSGVGALGLMQIMPLTGAELARRHGLPWDGPDTLLDPVINVKLGIAYLRSLTNRYADTSAALAAYNWGPGRIDRRLRRGLRLPTGYSNRVIQAYGERTRAEVHRS